MSSIVIGFGGTGAKMVQSFIMLAASGAIKLAQPVKVLLVDQDKSNGNTQRCAEAIDLYGKIHQIIGKVDDSVRPFNVKLDVYADVVWQPLRQVDVTMAKVFRHSESAGKEDMTSLLLETLYTPRELTVTTLGEGFRGHPNIGAPIFAHTLNFNTEPWHTLWQDIEQGINAAGSTVVLCGSIFGGTGAAGIPSTCKIIKEKLKALGEVGKRGRIVLNLVMPYFSIREQQDAGLQAEGKHFAANSKAALQYYHDARYLEFCDELYLVGENDPAPIEKASIGGKTQRNPAHPVELFAACNIVTALDAKKKGALLLTQRSDPHAYRWDDLPLNDHRDTYLPGYVRARMSAFARTCYTFQSLREALQNYKAKASVGDLAWLMDYFPDPRQINLAEVEQVERFAQLFLEWIGEMQLSAASIVSGEGTYRAEWFNTDDVVTGRPADMTVQLKPLDPDRIADILSPRLTEERYTFRMLHHDLQRKTAGSMRTGLDGFLCDVYRQSGKTLAAFNPHAAGGTHA